MILQPKLQEWLNNKPFLKKQLPNFFRQYFYAIHKTVKFEDYNKSKYRGDEQNRMDYSRLPAVRRRQMIDIKDIQTKKLFERASGILEQTRPFTELMMRYKCAMLEVKTKLDVLNTQLSLENDRNPFESINCRLKTVPSIIEKLNRKGFELSAASIEKNLNDVAGIRVICSFPDDIYVLADKLCSQDDIRLIEKKDYIKNPKPNGYRSLHLILEIPIFLMTEKKFMRVEVQFRTIAMDFWASLEHKLKYKKDIKSDVNEISRELRECAEEISRLDNKMQEIHRKINYDSNAVSLNFDLPI